MKKSAKTNAMRLLEHHNIAYITHEYPHHHEAVDGETVAVLLNQDPHRVFKTLVTQAKSHQIYVFVLPVNKELDLKKAALLVQQKSLEMIPVKQIQALTGYIRGGCSPLAMKKVYPTWVDSSALLQPTIIFSGGQIGTQIEMNPLDLKQIIPVHFDEVSVDDSFTGIEK